MAAGSRSLTFIVMQEAMAAETIPLDRSLTEEEQRLIAWLLEHGKPEASEYLSQIPLVSAVGQCSCGCPTIDLSVSGKRATWASKGGIVADFLGETAQRVPVGVMLWIKEDKLFCLEVYSFIPVEGTFSLPLVETLKPW